LEDHKQSALHLKKASEQILTMDVLQDCRKQARNCGEDLLDDTLALDKLSGLCPADRANRREAISALDALLEEVDMVKAHLARAEKQLQEQSSSDAREEESGGNSHSPSEEDAPDEDVLPMLAEEVAPEEGTVDEEGVGAGEMEVDDSMDRTLSQVSKQMQMQDVLSGLHRHEESVVRLKEKLARLVSRLSREEYHLDEEQKVLDDCRKSVRNCSEDVMEVMGNLDDLSGLFPEDRATRKQALTQLDALLEEIEVVKRDLKEVEKNLSEKLAQKRRNASANAGASTKAGKQPVLRLRGNAAPKSVPQHMGHADVCGRGPRCQQSDDGRSSRSSLLSSSSSISSSSTSSAPACSAPEQGHTGAATNHPAEVPVPSQRFWKALEFPLRFRPSEERGCYLLSCPVPSHLEDVKLELSPGATHLTVSGVHLPTAAEVEGMHKQISFAAQHCFNQGRTSLDPEWHLELYAKLSQGKFGFFSETFELPRDVNVSDIEASCQQGVLQVRIPKHVRRARTVQHPCFGNPFFSM